MGTDIRAFWSQRCLAKTRQIGRIHQKFLTQSWYKYRPGFSRAAKTMNQYNRRATPSSTVVMHSDTAQIACFLTYASKQHACMNYIDQSFPWTTIDTHCQERQATNNTDGA